MNVADAGAIARPPDAEDYAISFGVQMAVRIVPAMLVVMAIWYV